MSRAVLSIGSNMEDRIANLQTGVDGFGESVIAVSPVYSTAPWGGVEQQDFLNAIVVVKSSLVSCRQWLEWARATEAAAERMRDVRWGPRTLDVDIVACDDVISDDPELTLPHPRAHQRAFVLVPWLDVEPEARLTVDGESLPVRDRLAALPESERAGVVKTFIKLLGPWSP